ncbi:YutD family protein [Aerococcus sp. NPDC058936]|uniref:YutD family protein n=1 Tax=Aerococcus sp. NPDC058936 TaxID=3346674 RepID=UPI00366CE1C2
MLSRKKQEELKEQRASFNYPIAQIKQTSQETLEINGQSFVLVDNYRDALDIEALADRYMDILDVYDFVVGDWSYEQLRLKGFFANDAKIGSLEQKIKHLPDYLLEYGSFGASYFVLLHERTGEEIQKRNEAFWTQQKDQNQEPSRSRQNKNQSQRSASRKSYQRKKTDNHHQSSELKQNNGKQKQRRSNKKHESAKGPSFSISQNKESNKNTENQKPVKRKVVTKRQHSFSIKEKGDKA